MTLIRTVLALVALVLFTGLPAHAQGTAAPALALPGMDVVSYFNDGGPVKGQAAFREDFDGVRYLYVSRSIVSGTTPGGVSESLRHLQWCQKSRLHQIT